MDSQLRTSERSDNRAAFLQAKLRSGELSYSNLELLAYCGDEAAQALLTRCPPWCINIGGFPKSVAHVFGADTFLNTCTEIPTSVTGWAFKLAGLWPACGIKVKAVLGNLFAISPQAKRNLSLAAMVNYIVQILVPVGQTGVNDYYNDLRRLMQELATRWALSPSDVSLNDHTRNLIRRLRSGTHLATY